MPEAFRFKPQELRPSDHRKLVHQFMDWGTVRVDLVKRTGLIRQETKLVLDRHSFLMNLKGEAKNGEDFIEGRSIGFTPRRPGSLVYIPPYQEWRGWDEGDVSGSYLAFLIETKFADEILGSESLSALKPTVGFRDNVIESALQKVGMELKNPDPISAIMAETQAAQIFAQLVRLNGFTKETVKGGLSPFDFRRVVGIMKESLASSPTLDELAGAIGLSKRHFIRAFKQTTGKTPYVYLSDYRMKRAADLLRDTNSSATEIAMVCGFSSSSHFAFAFKKDFGLSPLEYRRRWRS